MLGGYAGTPVRAIAKAAGVDVAMVYYFFGDKDGLFRAAASGEHPLAELPALLTDGTADVGHRLVRSCLARWDAGDMEPFLAMWTSAVGHDKARDALVEVVLRPLVADVVERLDVPDAAARVELVASHLAGLAVARYRLRIEPLASADPELLVDLVGPAVQQYLTAGTSG
ncbi:MAG: TetR family transcriptional regulator [Streptosporangiales bacterium]|nr:TetR family transcriptional regulator [Streptosporangiales bacterium]